MSALTPVIASTWLPYGLRDDPFFQAPLEPSDSDASSHPIRLFVGRAEELQLLGGQILGSSNSRAVLEGNVGVGKTSLVSRLKVALSEHRVLTHADPVRVDRGMTARGFCAEVLKILTDIRASIRPAGAGAAGRRLAQAVRNAPESDEERFWRRVTRMTRGEDTAAVGGSIMAVGGQYQPVRLPAELGDVSLFEEVGAALAYLADGGTQKVLIHVNNLEHLARADATAAADLMLELRDVFLLPHGHWLFVGADDVDRRVFRIHEQVGSVIPITVTLDPLPAEDVRELLRRRYAHLAVPGRDLTPPVTLDAIPPLYRRYQGDLRSFLRLLSQAAQFGVVRAGGVAATLDVADVVAIMATRIRPIVLDVISEADLGYLDATVGGKAADSEFRVTDVVHATGMKQGSASKFTQRLERQGAIRGTRVEGRNRYYQVRHGPTSIALRMT